MISIADSSDISTAVQVMVDPDAACCAFVHSAGLLEPDGVPKKNRAARPHELMLAHFVNLLAAREYPETQKDMGGIKVTVQTVPVVPGARFVGSSALNNAAPAAAGATTAADVVAAVQAPPLIATAGGGHGAAPEALALPQKQSSRLKVQGLQAAVEQGAKPDVELVRRCFPRWR